VDLLRVTLEGLLALDALILRERGDGSLK
jgi:hypothetical protein